MIVDENNLYKTTFNYSNGTKKVFVGRLEKRFNGKISKGKMIFDYYIVVDKLRIPVNINDVEKVED